LILTLVTGPPCSGKTSYVHRMRSELDVVIDLDALMQALGSPVPYGHDSHYVFLALSMRIACLRNILQKGINANVWYVTCWPSHEEIALLPPSIQRFETSATAGECKEWATASGRPAIYPSLIDNWFRAHRPLN
jgi:hypothetical protein